MDHRKLAPDCVSFCQARALEMERYTVHLDLNWTLDGAHELFWRNNSHRPVLFPRIGIRLPGFTIRGKRVIEAHAIPRNQRTGLGVKPIAVALILNVEVSLDVDGP